MGDVKTKTALPFGWKVFFCFVSLFFLFSLLFIPLLQSIVESFENDPLRKAAVFKDIYFLAIITLFLFGTVALSIVFYLTYPIKKIINAIGSYKGDSDESIPKIPLVRGLGPQDPFGTLARTFNSLSKRIEHQISHLVQERNNTAAILESLGEGVIAVDQSMIVTYINRMAEVFLNTTKGALLGKNFSFYQTTCHQLIRDAQEKGEPQFMVLKDDKKPRRYIDAMAVPRGKEGAIVVLQDRTSVQKVIELGKDFIANASHELKTPITIIRGFAETLHDHPELSPEVYKEITQKIVTNCYRMETLVRNLLTLAAVDEGLPSSRLHECDLHDLAEQARLTILNVHPKAKIEIIARGEIPLFLGDGDLLLQAILNLLDNAVKYSSPQAHVIVFLERKEGGLAISVKDNGVGIPQEDLDRIFERFYSVNKSHSRSLGGSGLGLSIVERIVEKHKGKIHVESEIQKGSIFTIILPLIEEEK